MVQQVDFFKRIQLVTEGYLTRRKRAKRLKKEKLKKKNWALDWLEAFLWAAGMVLLINQYLFQAYQIPSGSMIDTLRIDDRIFVNKLIYGPELLPGLGKIPSPIKPRRNDVIIFENPSYESQGPVFDIAQRILYMLTLSMLDIDRDDSGEPKPHFLIKRAVGMGKDRFVTQAGDLLFRYDGEDHWQRESDFNNGRGYAHTLSRLVPAQTYPLLEAAGHASAFMNLGLPIPDGLRDRASRLAGLQYDDLFARERARLELLRGANPHEPRYRAALARNRLGWYVPEGRIMPLGDNRDNSRDGRFFGPVKESKILGKGALKYWPPTRMGTIR